MANDLPRNGPSGTYSQAWMSRADQSLSRVRPKTWSANASVPTRSPSRVGAPTTKPSSASMSSRRAGPVGGPVPPPVREPLAARSTDVRAGDDDGAGAAVVADRQVPPVGLQRLVVGAEDPADVGGVVERAVEVDVVGDLERHLHRHLVDGHEVRLDEVALGLVGEQPGQPGAHRGPRRPAQREQRVERRRLEDVGDLEHVAGRDRGEVDDLVADADADPGRLVRRVANTP